MNTYAVYFTPRGALATWPLASDTLFGAVCWGIRSLGLMDDDQLTGWLEAQRAAPGFAFSHAFPAYLNGNASLRLYPRPATFQPKFDDFDILAAEWQQKQGNGMTLKSAKADVAVAGKRLKQLGYVSEGVLGQIAAGSLQPLDGLRAVLFESGQAIPRAGILCLAPEAKKLPEKLYEREAMQHNHIDRMAGATVEGLLFYRQETFFASGAGLWALLRAEEKDFTAYIRPALAYLADTGFGADRTSGKGHFDIRVEAAPPLPQAESPRAMLSLSHYLPAGGGEFDPQGEPLAYTLKTLRPKRERRHPRPVAGQQSVPIYKKALRVFEPGSVFALTARKEIYGRLARLTPSDQEAVYQSGAALMVYL